MWNPFRRSKPSPVQRTDALLEKTRNSRRARLDAWVNIVTGVGTAKDKASGGRIEATVVDSETAQKLWRFDYLGKKIVEWQPADAMKRGYDIRLGRGGANQKQKVERFMSYVEDLHVNSTFVQAGQYEGAYGGAAIYPVFGDASGRTAAEPLRPDGPIPPINSLLLFEARELQPMDYYRSPADGKKFGMPSLYRVRSISSNVRIDYEIHESRLVVFPGIRVSRESPSGAEMGWGDNVFTPMFNVLRDYHLSWAGLVALLQDFAQGIFKMSGLAELIDEGEDDAVVNRLLNIDMLRSILRAIVIDKDDEFRRETTSITDFPDALQLMMLCLSSAGGMSATKMFGRSPAGMDATGESDITQDDDRVMTWQDKHKDQLERLLGLCMRQTSSPFGGQEPQEWSAVYRPLRSLGEEAEANRRKTIAETDQIYHAMGVPALDILRSRFGGDTFSGDTTVDWAALDAQLKIKEEMERAALEAAENPTEEEEEEPTRERLIELGDEARGDAANRSEHSGTMVALFVPLEVARGLTLEGGLPAEELHVTLAYLGKELDDATKAKVRRIVEELAYDWDPFAMKLGGVGRFAASSSSEGMDVVYLSVDSPALMELRAELLDRLEGIGVAPSTEHSYTPHVTLSYIPMDAPMPIGRFAPITVQIDWLSAAVGPDIHAYKFAHENGAE